MTMTPWGYSVDGDLADILSLDDYVATGRVAKPGTKEALSAASAAVRMFCGWHVCPSMTCQWTGEGSGKVIDLPALYVSAVTEVTETRNGITSTLVDGQVEWAEQGLLRRTQFLAWPDGWRSVSATYVAGLPEVPADLKQVVAQLVDNALAAPAGVAAEQAGGVSLTYNRVGGMAGGIAISDREACMLAPYRIVRM